MFIDVGQIQFAVVYTHIVCQREPLLLPTHNYTHSCQPRFLKALFFTHQNIIAGSLLQIKYSIWDNLWTQKSHEIVQLFNHFHDIRCIKKIVIREPMLKKVPGCVSALFSRREKRCNNTFERISASFAKRNSLLNVTNPWADEWCKSFLNCLRVRDVAFVA